MGRLGTRRSASQGEGVSEEGTQREEEGEKKRLLPEECLALRVTSSWRQRGRAPPRGETGEHGECFLRTRQAGEYMNANEK